jgi:hypothetical protein
MSQPINFARDVNGYNTFAPPVSTNKYSANLLSGGHSTITVPTNVPYWVVNFSFQPGSDMWVNYKGVNASAPAGNTFATTTSELLPGSRVIPSTYINGSGVTVANTIDILNNGTAASDVGVVLYANPT